MSIKSMQVTPTLKIYQLHREEESSQALRKHKRNINQLMRVGMVDEDKQTIYYSSKKSQGLLDLPKKVLF